MIDEQKWDELQKRFTPSSLREGELDFISEISSYEYDFVVFLSNKCFLSSILSAKTMNIDLLDKKNILTQSSFFQHIGKLAEYYIKHNQFPKILLVDDLMYRGKTLNIFLSRIQDALFNEVNTINDSFVLKGPQQIKTTNMETDQITGTYEVCFKMSSLTTQKQGDILQILVLGEAGEMIIAEKTIFVDEFDKNGFCESVLTYQIGNIPKVFFSIIINENVEIVIDEISWKRIA